MSAPTIVLDTNIFVAGGFNRQSRSARILEKVRSGELRMIWNEQTRRETAFILNKIPPLSWSNVSELFQENDRFDGKTEPEKFDGIPDPDDRKYAALCAAAGATLITNDSHLLDYRDQTGVTILTPAEFWERTDAFSARERSD